MPLIIDVILKGCNKKIVLKYFIKKIVNLKKIEIIFGFCIVITNITYDQL